MHKSGFRSILVGGAIIALFSMSVAYSQTGNVDQGASVPLTKQQLRAKQKAERKADRAAARTKNSAELKSLEQNGYVPNRNAADYPVNIQNAEKKKAESN